MIKKLGTQKMIIYIPQRTESHLFESERSKKFKDTHMKKITKNKKRCNMKASHVLSNRNTNFTCSDLSSEIRRDRECCTEYDLN